MEQTQTLAHENFCKVTRYSKNGAKTTYLRRLPSAGKSNYVVVYDLLKEYGPATCKDLESVCDSPISNMSAVLSMLEHNGYVHRNETLVDRARQYDVTSKVYEGQKLSKRLPKAQTKQKELFPSQGTLPSGVAIAVPRSNVKVEALDAAPSLVEVKVKRTLYVLGKELSEEQAHALVDQLTKTLKG
jgi:DNA-binding MarR family transcriptional regulator